METWEDALHMCTVYCNAMVWFVHVCMDIALSAHWHKAQERCACACGCALRACAAAMRRRRRALCLRTKSVWTARNRRAEYGHSAVQCRNNMGMAPCQCRPHCLHVLAAAPAVPFGPRAPCGPRCLLALLRDRLAPQFPPALQMLRPVLFPGSA